MSSNIKLRCLDNNGNDLFVVNSDFGVISSSTRPSANSTTGSLVFYGGVSINNSANAFSNSQGGALTVAGGASFGGDIFVDRSVVASNIIATTGITTGNLNFTGSLYQNGLPYTSSQWTTTAGNISYTSGSVVASNIIATTDITTGNLNFTGNLYQNGVLFTPGSSSQWTTTAGNVSYTSGSVVASTVSTSNIIASNTTLGNITLNNFTTGTLLASSLNLGVASMFSGSFMASNNVTSPSPVSGLAFTNSSIRSFNATVSVAIDNGSVTSAVYILYGNQSDSGWSLFVDTNGISSIVFTINSSGQVLYTSSNISGFVSSTFRYRVEQFTASGTYASLAVSTVGSYIVDTIQINNTTDSIPGTNNGALYVLGGTTIKRSINILSTENASGIGTGGSLTALGGAAVSKDLIVGGKVGINNTNPSCALDVGGDIFASGNVTSFSDIRLKRDIVTITDAIEKVKALRGVYYTQIASNKKSLGLIAQEVQEILPEAVDDMRGDGYLGVAYGNIIGLLVEAIKELSDRVNELEK